jgi:hypothetical protein
MLFVDGGEDIVSMAMPAGVPSWIGGNSVVVADNLYAFQGASYSNACFNLSVDNNFTYLLHNAYYGSGWKQRLTGYAPTMLQTGSAAFNFSYAADTGSDASISWIGLMALNSSGAIFNDAGNEGQDFRVESNLQANMLYVDAGNDIVNFNSTQTTSQQGAGYRADGFQREFQRDTNVLSINQSADASTQARTRRLTIELHNYGPVKITIMNGGHYYNNGGTFGFRETTFYVAMESTTLRINSKVDGVNAGTAASSYGVPTIAAAGSQPRCQIDFTVAAGMTCSTYVKVEGFGANEIISLADV